MTDSTPARMIAFIQQLYDVERAAAADTPEARQTRRQGAVGPTARAGRRRTHPTRRARVAEIACRRQPPLSHNQWGALQRFVEDGRLAIDNNRAENQLRVVALGRKNWLFAGSFEGARRAALLYSLVQSCKLIDVSPFAYLKEVLLRVATHPQRLIHQLTLRGWADTFGPHASV